MIKNMSLTRDELRTIVGNDLNEACNLYLADDSGNVANAAKWLLQAIDHLECQWDCAREESGVNSMDYEAAKSHLQVEALDLARMILAPIANMEGEEKNGNKEQNNGDC